MWIMSSRNMKASHPNTAPCVSSAKRSPKNQPAHKATVDRSCKIFAMKLTIHATICAALGLIFSVAVHAQAPAPGTTPWSGNLGGGFAFTDGNSDTTNFNLSFALTHNPKTRNVVKWAGLYLRGTQNKADTIDRTSTTLRDEFAFSGRT